MSQPLDHEARLTALESRVEVVAADAAAARRLAAAHDRDLAELPVKIDANRRAINALGLQTAGRFDSLETAMRAGFDETRTGFDETRLGFDEMRTGFTTVRAVLDQQAGGMQHIVDLLSDRGDDTRPA